MPTLATFATTTNDHELNHDSELINMHPKHEIIRCERCEAPFECKANSFTKCQCSTVQLTLNEVQYVSELYEGCLCANCLLLVQQEYREAIG
jgi:hypothetical protein